MKRTLSALARPEIIEDLESTTFDLLVIGGGITGAGIAWDAAKRGIKTALIEREDFAFGTSSRSTKLIHGGLRYLKKGEFKLVRQVGREREWLYRSAPHLLTPMPMLLPLYKKGTFGYWSASLGLFVYDRLAGVEKEERRVMHRAGQTARLEPLLKGEGLKGGGLYYEYRADDARLTVEVLKTAARHGAWVANYVEAADFLYYKSKVCGVRAFDRLSGKELEIRAKRVINAAGPWVDLIRSRDHALKGKRLLLTKGVHLVVDHSKLPVRQGAYFDTPDGRMIFVIPRDGKTYIGTTDTVYTGDPAKPRVTTADRDYLLEAVGHVFPTVSLTVEDVESMWAGLRPLIRQEGKQPSDISRRDEIWESPSGLFTIAGGKLTGFRKMAEEAVDMVSRSLEREALHAHGPCTTDKEPISGGDSGRFETYQELREHLLVHGAKMGLPLSAAKHLVGLYGSNAAHIYDRLEKMDKRFREWRKAQKPRKGTGRLGDLDLHQTGQTTGAAGMAGAAPSAAQAGLDNRVAGYAARPVEADGLGAERAGAASERLPEEPGLSGITGQSQPVPVGTAAAKPRPQGRPGPALPEGGRQTAAERAAWVQEWMEREKRTSVRQEAADGERAAWVQEWNERKRAAEAEQVGPETGKLQAMRVGQLSEMPGEPEAALHSADSVLPEGVAADDAAPAAESRKAVDVEFEGSSSQLREVVRDRDSGRSAGSYSASVRDERDITEWRPGILNGSDTGEQKVEEAWRLLEEMTEQAKREKDVRRSIPASAPTPEREKRPQAVMVKLDPEELGGNGSVQDSASKEAQNEEDGHGSFPSTVQSAEDDASGGRVTDSNAGESIERSGGVAESPAVYGDMPRDGAEDTIYYEEASGQDEQSREESPTVTTAETDEVVLPEGTLLERVDYCALKAEILYCIEEEMIIHAADFLIRRTGLLYFNRARAEEIAIDVIELMAEALGWDEAEILNQKLMLASEWEYATVAVGKDSST